MAFADFKVAGGDLLEGVGIGFLDGASGLMADYGWTLQRFYVHHQVPLHQVLFKRFKRGHNRSANGSCPVEEPSKGMATVSITAPYNDEASNNLFSARSSSVQALRPIAVKVPVASAALGETPQPTK